MAPTEFKEPRPPADVSRKLESAKAALKKQESKQGASVEEITAELTRAKKAYETAVNEVKTMIALNKVRVFTERPRTLLTGVTMTSILYPTRPPFIRGL